MNLIIVSWNIQGKYSLAQLIDRMIENDWDLLIVLEPQQVLGKQVSYPGISIGKVPVGDQNIYVLHGTEIIKCTMQAKVIMGGERQAVLIEITALQGASYRILTAHAPYRKNDGSAQQYQQNALAWAQKNNVDLVVGDLNTYGSKVGSSSRVNFINLSEGLGTSSGDKPLDKALLRNEYYGLPSDVNAQVMELEDVELPDVPYVQSGSRSSERSSVAQSRQGRGKKSDHRPLVVMLPARKLLSSKVSSSGKLVKSTSKTATAIDGDGHCLYRCIAHILWGDQNRYQEVRKALADYVMANWRNHPYLQHLAGISQLALYASIVKNTNAWGGEFELATLAEIYNLRITMHSPQGFAQAVYGNGVTSATIRHTGDHFEVL